MVTVEKAAFGGNVDRDVDSHCVADVVVYTTLIGEIHAVFYLRDELLDAIAGVPVALHFVRVNLRSMASTWPYVSKKIRKLGESSGLGCGGVLL